MSNVKYGQHERNVLDFWKAQSNAPTPLVIFIHGGGFVGGDKSNIGADVLRRLLGAGVSVAAIRYRFVLTDPLPAAHHDSRRALQFLRSKAQEWNIDKTRVGAMGGSAGAQLSMYLGFHDEMANPKSADPVERESTRLTAVVSSGGQTTMDLAWWAAHIPGFTGPDRELSVFFGTADQEKIKAIVKEISALSLISKDDPPLYMTYAMAPGDAAPQDAIKLRGWMIHHVTFGIELKKKMDALGLESHLKYPGAQVKYASPAEFFLDKFGMAK